MANMEQQVSGLVLVVDDDEGVRRVLSRWAADMGYTVQAAAVLATGLIEMDPMVTLRPGVVGYIVKPFNHEDLAQAVKRGMAERRRLQAEHRSHPLLSDAARRPTRCTHIGPSNGTAPHIYGCVRFPTRLECPKRLSSCLP